MSSYDHQNRPNPLSVFEIAEIWAQALNAVEAVHRCGIVHFDLKPENFLCFINRETPKSVVEDGLQRGGGGHEMQQPPRVRLKLTDFGVSAQMKTGATHVTKNERGTLEYLWSDFRKGENPRFSCKIFILKFLSREGSASSRLGISLCGT